MSTVSSPHSEVFPLGFRLAGVAAGIKPTGALDVGLLVADAPCAGAAVFTRNLVRAAPVLASEAHLEVNANAMAGVVVNSGCANAVTGAQGYADALAMCEAAARATGHDSSAFFVLSTGLIGSKLPMPSTLGGIARAGGTLSRSPESVTAFARSLMTTDTREKTSTYDEGGVRFAGFAKGAGMIHPDMATMLAVVVTDALATPTQLRDALRACADETFNAISIDGDTSTNDTVVLLASGRSGTALSETALRAALRATCTPLARSIVSDGEGVHHVVALTVEGCASHTDARQMARTVSTSMLVKTAIFGRDPNWGRILAAAGRSGIAFHLEACSLELCGTPVLEQGVPVEFDKGALSERMGAHEWACTLRVGTGGGRSTVWFSDLSHDYVRLNSAYST